MLDRRMNEITEKLQRVMCPSPRGVAPVQLTIDVVRLNESPYHMVQAVQLPFSLRGSYREYEIENRTTSNEICLREIQQVGPVRYSIPCNVPLSFLPAPESWAGCCLSITICHTLISTCLTCDECNARSIRMCTTESPSTVV